MNVTQAGLDILKKEKADLLAERPHAVSELKKARDMGDLSENGYYKAARAKLSFIDHRLRRLTYDLKQSKLVGAAHKDIISIGSCVTLSDGKKDVTYNIVGDLEADPKQAKLSTLSPLGNALVGKKLGEEILVHTPNGEIRYTIIALTLSSV